MASDGVTIESLSPGDGVTFPKRGDNLTMHYDGHLASNNKKFDSSRDRNQPFEFTIGVGQVIRGWDEGVAKLSLGERAKLHIKSHFGYGARGAGGDIPPNADLVFDVQLLAINGVYQRNASGKRACGGCGFYEDEIKSETPVAYKSCANCRQVYYCGKPCQVRHWSSHKGVCKRLQAEAASRTAAAAATTTATTSTSSE